MASRVLDKPPTESSPEPDGSAATQRRTLQSTSESSTSEDSRSSADIESIELADPDRPQSGPVHDHHLPSGWMCNYDADTGHYKFEFGVGTKRDEEVEAKTPTMDHFAQTSRRPTLDRFECKFGYHFPTSPTPSMISDLAKQVQKNTSTAPAAKSRQIGYGKSKITIPTDEEDQAKRLKEMFPTAPGLVVEQMIRIYHGREGLIKAALISLGYKRVSEYGAQQATAQSPIMLMMAKPSSKKLFEKLVSYFPDKNEGLIKSLMYTHKEVEHEIISVLVESGQSNGASSHDEASARAKADQFRPDKGGAIMKLRYLKVLYPDCEEIEIYHLLHCHDLNTHKVIEEIEKRGHKRANIDEVMKNRKSHTQQMKAQSASTATKEKGPEIDPLEAHRSRTKPTVTDSRVVSLKENLKKSLQGVDDDLLLKALEASDYNETLAKKFIEEMEPTDSPKYKQRYTISHEQPLDVVLYPCKGIQKGDTSFMSITGNEYVAIPRSVVECDNALALLKVDASTFTQDDIVVERQTHAQGKRPDLAVGSIFESLEVRDSLRRGASEILRSGSSYKQFCVDSARPRPNRKATGPVRSRQGGRNESLCKGHNPKLIQRTHPFFVEPRGVFDLR